MRTHPLEILHQLVGPPKDVVVDALQHEVFRFVRTHVHTQGVIYVTIAAWADLGRCSVYAKGCGNLDNCFGVSHWLVRFAPWPETVPIPNKHFNQGGTGPVCLLTRPPA